MALPLGKSSTCIKFYHKHINSCGCIVFDQMPGQCESVTLSCKLEQVVDSCLLVRIKPEGKVDSCKRLSINRMVSGLRLPRSSHGFISFTFQTQLIKPSQVFIRRTGIQTLPPPVNFIIIKRLFTKFVDLSHPYFGPPKRNHFKEREY